jgi:predicted aldo/keto reductase-like oxidoreductase
MQYRIDKKSGKELSVLGMGCMRFPAVLGVTGKKKAQALVETAIADGINYFDTAWLYAGNEETLGEALENLGARNRINIATKLPILLVKKPEDFDRYFNETLKRLRTTFVDYYLLHMLTDVSTWERLQSLGIREWAAAKQKSGAIRQFGFSFHGNRDSFLALLAVYEWDFCQIQFNYSDENFQAGLTGLNAAAERGIPVVIMEPLLGGRLADSLPKEARGILSGAKMPEGVANTPAAWALRWVLNHRGVTVVLSGMTTIPQIRENASVAGVSTVHSLTKEELDVYGKVRAVFSAQNKIACTGCGYCIPCPRGINIPGVFSAYNSSYLMGRLAGWQQYMTSAVFTSKKHGGPSLCVACGRCERHCPQNLSIIQQLRLVRRRMEPFYFRLLIAGVRRFLGHTGGAKPKGTVS